MILGSTLITRTNARINTCWTSTLSEPLRRKRRHRKLQMWQQIVVTLQSRYVRIDLISLSLFIETHTHIQNTGTPLEKRLQTHYQILMISTHFENQSLECRYAVVYQVLMNELWDSRRAASTHGPHPTRWKKFGTVSKHVCDLPEFRYFLRTFELILKTPEEFGSDDVTTSQTTRNKELLRQLTAVMMKGESEELNVRSHEWANTANSANPKKVRADFVKCQLRLCRAAVVFQRVYRRHLSRRMYRVYVKRHRAATMLSRVYRGYCDRVFTSAYRKIRTRSAIKLQSFRRGVSRIHIINHFENSQSRQIHRYSDGDEQSHIVDISIGVQLRYNHSFVVF